MRPIKFDLPLNGKKIATLDQLEENLTPEILDSFRSGKLAKWLRARKLDEQAEAVEALLAADIKDEVLLFKKLCEVFVSEVDENDARAAIEEYNAQFASTKKSFLGGVLELFKKPEPSSNASSENADKAKQTEPPEKDEEQPTEDVSEAQFKLFEEGDEAQRIKLATHPKLSEKVQNKLLEEGTESVLVSLASNSCLIEEIQAKLAIIGSLEVRKALATNPKLDEKHQNYLATAGNREVKCKLAENPSLAPTIQSILVGGEYSVRRNLAVNLSLDIACQTKLITDEDIDVRTALASNPALKDDLQQQIFSKGDSKVIVALAKNPSLTEVLMSKLVTADSAVKESLASNLSLKLVQQAELTNTGDDDVRIALFHNPSVDAALKKRIIASFKESDLSYLEKDIERAEMREEERDRERDETSRKLNDYGYSGLFWSEKKRDELDRDDDRALRRCSEANQKVNALRGKMRKLKAIIDLQTK